MKNIKIFLASSIEDLKLDRLEVGDFFTQINGIYSKQNIFFELIKCEHYDNSLVLSGKQSQYDEEIRDSELAFFLFYTKAGDYTKHEFEVAHEKFKSDGKPKIITYFRTVEKAEDVSADVKSFMQLLDQELSHFYNTYNHIDTLKLGIIMQIKMLKLDDTPLEVKNGKIMLGDKQIAESENVPIFFGDKSFNEMKTKLHELTKKFYALREKFDENPDDFEIYKSFSAVASERASLMQSIKDVEKSKLEFIEEMYKNIEKGELSERQKEGYRLIQKGDIEGAKAVLSVDEIMSEVTEKEEQLKKVKNIEENIKDSLQINVNELLQRIEVLKSVAITTQSAAEIEQIYEKVYDIVNKNDLYKDPLYAYVRFLYHQKNYMKSISIAEEFLGVCADDVDKLYVLNILGLLYSDTQRMNDSERMYMQAIEIRERLAERNPEVYEPDLAMSYNNLGILYSYTQRMNDAERMYMQAIEIGERLAERNPEAYEPDLATSYNNLGVLYKNTQRISNAERMYMQAIEIGERLAERNPEAYEPDLAGSYYMYAILLGIQENTASEKYLKKAYEIAQKYKDSNGTCAQIYENLK